jgi:hypothetical protein
MTLMTHPALRGVALAALALTACKTSSHDSPSQGSGSGAAPNDAGAPDANLDACRAAAGRVPSLPPNQRAAALLDACHPCGDWGPLLRWNTLQTDGGPTRAAIEQAITACNAFCEPSAKQRFFGTLDGARGQPAHTPWRLLGEICKADVSAVPDARFMDGAYFALDRIARAIGDPALLAAIELPLPALSITSVGVDLPSVPVSLDPAGPAAITLDAKQMLVGALPVATLSPTGLQVAADYPGTAVDPASLGAALEFALSRPALAGHPVAVVAPYALDAARVADVIDAAGGHELRLAVAGGGPAGWDVPAALPIALGGRPLAAAVQLVLAAPAGTPGATDASSAAEPAIRAARAAAPADLLRAPVVITLARGARVDGLASLLGALGKLDVKAAVLVRSPAAPAAPAAPAVPPRGPARPPAPKRGIVPR